MQTKSVTSIADPVGTASPRFRLEAPWLILGALLLATFVSAYQNYQQSRLTADMRFGELAYASKLALAEEVRRDEELLRSASALVAALPDLNQQRWDSFFDARQDSFGEYHGLLVVQYEGAHAVSAKRLRLQRLFSASSEIPADDSLSTIPAVAEAIERADRSSNLTVSEAFPASGKDKKSALVAMVIPVYAPKGTTNAPVAMKPTGHLIGLMRVDSIVAYIFKQRGRNLALALIDGDYAMSTINASTAHVDPAFTTDLTINLGNRPWTLRVQSTPSLESELLSNTPTTILAVGVLGTMLLAGLVWLLTRLREQAESLAKRMTEQLRDQVKFTEDLIEFNPNPIFRLDDAGRFVAVNRAWEQLSGRRRTEVLGKKYAEFQGAEMAEQNETHDRELFASSSGYSAMEAFITNADGRKYETIVAKQVLRRADGKMDGLIGTITDVTPIKRLEREVARQREQLNLVIRSSQQGIWDIELGEGHTQYFSDRFREMLGYGDNDFPKVFSWEEHAHPDDIAAFRDELRKHFKGETPFFDLESRVKRRDGDYFWVRTRAIAQRDEKGRAVRFIGSIVDITDRKQAEATLIEASARVTEAARAKEAFLATMSHEIRTPLNGVLGMTGLLAETRLNDEQRDYIRLIRASGDTLLRLIDDVLDFSKIESGRMMLESVPVETIMLAEEAIELVAEKAREKQLALLYDIRDDVPFYILGDPTRLRQILLNLLSNAIKFTQKGEVRLTMTVRSLADGKLELEGRVRDSGIGIPPARIAQLFQPFTQVDASTTRKYGGTGLGLAIVKRLTQQMGGDVCVESVEGEGATFIFTIQTQQARGPLRPYMQRDVFDFLGKRMLLVDQNDHRRPIVQYRYARWGFDVVVASPEEAAAVLRRGPSFDIVLTDMVMPSPAAEAFKVALAEEDASRAQRNLPSIASILQSSISRSELSQRGITPPFRHDMFIIRPAGQVKMFEALMRAALHQPNNDVATRPFTPEPVYDLEYTNKMRALKADDNTPNIAAKANPRPPLPTSATSFHLLVAEDNEINQRVIQGMLSNLGHRITVVGDGKAAVRAALSTPFDAILMDIHMPEMDGMEAMAEIRAQLPDSCPPIVAMTAHAMAGDREQYLNAGMDDYISKPIRVADLTALTERLAKRLSHAPAFAIASPPAGSLANAGNAAPAFETIPILDIEQLEDLRYLPASSDSSNSDDSVGGLIRLFQGKAVERLNIMESSLASGDWKQLSEVAHSLRGAAASMGFPRVAASCKDIELASRRWAEGPADRAALPDKTELQKQFLVIKSSYNEANEALTKWFAESASSTHRR